MRSIFAQKNDDFTANNEMEYIDDSEWSTLSIVFVMHQWQYTLELIQYQIPDTWSSAKTTYQMVIVSRPFLRCFGLWITKILHYKAQQRQLSQGCTIFIYSYYVICKNYARLCGNLQIMRSDAIIDQLCGIAPSHNIRGPV